MLSMDVDKTNYKSVVKYIKCQMKMGVSLDSLLDNLGYVPKKVDILKGSSNDYSIESKISKKLGEFHNRLKKAENRISMLENRKNIIKNDKTN